MHSSPSAPSGGSGRRRTAVRTAAAAAASAVALSLFAASPAAPAVAVPEDLASRFTFAVLPDTQFYSRYSADQFLPRYGTDPYRVQTEFLAENADALNIPFVAHLGDVVDRVGTTREWEAADTAMQTLDDAQLPYSILPGNHDVRNSNDTVTDVDYDLANEPFLQWFGPDRAAGVSTFQGSDPTGLSQYHVFEAEGQEFMVLALTWRASEQTFQWARDAMAAHPDVPVILTTHSLLNIEADQETPRDTEYGDKLWDELIAPSDQIFLTLNGHFHGATKQTKTNDAGHAVTQVLMDYQMAYEGGNGYLGLMEFDLTNNAINVQTASPWVVSKPQDTLTSYDQPFLEAPGQQFTIDIDFEERFAAFDPDFTAGEPTQPKLTQAARDILLDGFEGPDPISTEIPGNELDYVEADGTVAHWRMGSLDEGVLPEGGVVPDVANGNDLTRVSIADSGSSTAEVGDVTIVKDDVHDFSSDGAAMCFANADQAAGRFSYLETADDAPANDETFDDGYTLETFIKLDASWTAEANGWSKAIVRSGNRSELPGMPWSQWDYTASPAALGISNLREFQYTEVPTETTKGDRTAWSGEIMVDSWAHVAIVNDPDTSTTTMYVDGAPVLRNATDTLGQSINEDTTWLFGADFVDEAARNGWNGCIGETRVIDHATDQTEWLTQRADLSTLTVDAPTGTLPWDTEITELTGTGFPGAEVTLGDAPESTDAAAVAARAAGELAGTTTVAEDGTWTMSLDAALPPGSYSGAVVQALGARASDAVAFDFAIAAAPGEPTTEPTAPGTDPSDPGTGGGDDAGNGTGSAPDGDLAVTGADTAPWLLGAGIALVLGAAALLIARVRHRRHHTAD
ncbi:calcineurin-like phosphoesterase family protein [Labedella gwakjiensis]|uniref:Calcineurin-like phosphoesterase family protein n=1 Tax=Labedella gwakjiensis TaxID=390269 RepID=A0A2P8GRF8_9MICO|nr:metallophosphoesterase [Labedella gwakjiensis]PSL36563.1 calcineurin-like phosphoesterase family protein [Labedella gwakjiensis]